MDISSARTLIIGGSRGTGKALAEKLNTAGANVTVVARKQASLDQLASGITTIATDASADGEAEHLFDQVRPDLLILAGGHQTRMASFADMDWAEFSATWNIDVKIAHAFMALALTRPMAPGGRVVSFSSGAALNGSPLSGGYAGAKRMQHYLANYAQREADLRQLDLTFTTIIPAQLMAGSSIGVAAAEAYGAASGGSAEKFMAQWSSPLTPDRAADCVMAHLTEAGPAGAYKVTGEGMAALA